MKQWSLQAPSKSHESLSYSRIITILILFGILVCAGLFYDLLKNESIRVLTSQAKYEKDYAEWEKHRAEWRLGELAYKNARKQNTLEAFQNFLDEHPNSPWKEKFLFQRDRLAFKEAFSTRSPAALQLFIDTYPEGYFTSKAEFYKELIQECPAVIKRRFDQ